VTTTTHTIVRCTPFYKGVTHDLRSPTQTDGKLTYAPGTVVVADGFDDDPLKDCGKGINFCRSIAHALKWGPKVVELAVDPVHTIVDTGDKLRARQVRVLGIATLQFANLESADLEFADLRSAWLGGKDRVLDGNLAGWQVVNGQVTRA
jgi:hypothetical protein